MNARAIPAAKAAPNLLDRSGSGAVQMSVQQNTMQSNMSVASGDKKEAERQVLVRNSVVSQFVGNKNFQNQNNVWIDTDFNDKVKLPEITVKFGSDEYFSLVNRERDLAQYLALGQQVIVVWKSKVYKVIQ